MFQIPTIGLQSLQRKPNGRSFKDYKVSLARGLDDYIKVSAIRSVAFIGEQNCPFSEEFDGNDLSASHLIAYFQNEPVATLRLRWFATFGKIERVCVLPGFRGTHVVSVLLAHAFEFAARKGYELMIAQIQARLWPLWGRILKCELRDSRPSFHFSEFEYFEIEIPLRKHPNALHKDVDPYVLIRPEGEWDKPGVLDLSVKRENSQDQAA